MNVGPDHLSQIEMGKEPTNLDEGLPDAQLFAVRIVEGKFEDIIHFLRRRTMSKEHSIQQKKELVVHAVDFSITAGHLYKMGNDEIL